MMERVSHLSARCGSNIPQKPGHMTLVAVGAATLYLQLHVVLLFSLWQHAEFDFVFWSVILISGHERNDEFLI